MPRLQDKVALITGASRGLGEATALRFAEEGADVCVNYLTSDKQAADIRRRIEDMGRRAIAVRADVSDEDDARSLVAATHDVFGRIDILVNNAGLNARIPIVEMSVEEWDRIIRLDLRSVFLVTKFALPSMLERRYGKIINVSSLIASTGRENLTHYCAAKAGIIGFSKALALEVGPHNINVNILSPGAVEADIPNSSEEWCAGIIQKSALRRFGQDCDIANTALFLASDESKHFTGQTFHVSGGSYFP